MSIQQIESYDSRLDYLRHRQEYLGGADAAAVLGMNPFPDATRQQVWKEKTFPVEEVDRIDNPHIRRGQHMEDVVQRMVQGKEPWQTEDEALDPTAEPGDHHRHPDYEFIGGTPDMESPFRIYEIKAPTTSKFERIKKKGLPEYWWIQGEHYRLLRDKPVTFVLMDYNGWDLYTIEVPEPENALHERMLEEYQRFWENYVKEGTPPEEEDLKNVEIRVGKGGEKLNNLLADYYHANEKRKELDETRKEIKGRILTRCRGLDAVTTSEFRAQISRRSNGDTEWSALRVRPLRA